MKTIERKTIKYIYFFLSIVFMVFMCFVVGFHSGFPVAQRFSLRCSLPFGQTARNQEMCKLRAQLALNSSRSYAVRCSYYLSLLCCGVHIVCGMFDCPRILTHTYSYLPPRYIVSLTKNRPSKENKRTTFYKHEPALSAPNTTFSKYRQKPPSRLMN